MFGGFDPFNGINSMMRQQMQEMETVMNSMMGGGGMMMPGLFGAPSYSNPRQQMIQDNAPPNQRRNNVVANNNNNNNTNQFAYSMLDPFGGAMFGGGIFGPGGGLMGNMFQQMEQMKQRAANDPNSVVYSESKVISMAPGADGRIQTYESTDSLRKHGQVKETRSTLRDPTRGVEQMSIGHHIGDRGHVIEKKRVRGGQIEENQQFVNLEREKAREFDNEFTTATRNAAIGSNRYQLYDDTNQGYLPIEGRRSEDRARHASPYGRSSKSKKKTKGPIIEEAD